MPMTIEQIRAQMKDVRAEMTQARDSAVTLAGNPQASTEEMIEARNKLEDLKARWETLKEAESEMTEAQSANLQTVKQNGDAIKQAAGKFTGMGDFFNTVAKAQNRTAPQVDPRLAEYMNVRSSASGQNITTDADGGLLVPPDYSEELLNVAQSETILFPKVSRLPVAGNRLIEPLVDTESRKDTTAQIKGRNGGLLAYWTAEAADYTASTMKFTNQQTDLHKLTGLAYATEEMLEDLPAMAGIISAGFRDEFAFKIDDAIFEGSGSGMPLGIITTGTSPAPSNGALVTVAKESGQAAGTIVLANILKMWNAMPAKNRAKASWYINQDLEILLYQLLMNVGSVTAGEVSISNGFPLFVPAGGLASAPNGMLLGRPITPIEQASAPGTKGDIVMADLNQYRWIDKGAMTGVTSLHVRFLQDEMAFKFTYRAGGRPMWKNPITAYKGDTARSPYVALATRS